MGGNEDSSGGWGRKSKGETVEDVVEIPVDLELASDLAGLINH
jgi:hypothetical protein